MKQLDWFVKSDEDLTHLPIPPTFHEDQYENGIRVVSGELILISKSLPGKDVGISGVWQLPWMPILIEYNIVKPPDMSGTQQCIKCPSCQVVELTHLLLYVLIAL